MPKKFVGENSKAAAARARKTAAKESNDTKRQQELEDAYWKDEDKHVTKKQQRKEEQEKKKQKQQEKKAESRALYEQEMNSIHKDDKPQISKVTRAQILAEAEKKAIITPPKKSETHLEQPLEENINRLLVDGEEARSVEAAIALLSVKDDLEKHPEKRMKAAYTIFEETNMPRIKAENPTLRLSQLKQILRKEWMRAPENPFNQKLAAGK